MSAVVDFHVHLAKYESFCADAYNFFAGAFPSATEYDNFCRTYSDPDAFLQLLEQKGVDYAVVLAELSPASTGICTNESVAAFCRVSPKLIPFCTLNPYLNRDMAGSLEDLCLNQGFKGLKLLPSYNYYYPNDSMMYPVYADAERLGIPVLFHTGSSIFTGHRLKYARPIYLDDLAVDFPDLTIVMAHGGRGIWYDEALSLVRLHEHVYIDISGLPPKKLPDYFPDMERFAHKFLFGTDWPSVDMQKNIQLINSLNMTPEATVQILGENARQILGLT